MKTNWQIKKLDEVCEIVKDTPPEYMGIKNYFSTGAISNNSFYFPEEVACKKRPSRANSYPKTGDVGFAKMKFTNKVLLISDDLNGSIFSTGFCFLRPNKLLDSRYLFHFIISDEFQKLKNLYAGDGIMGGIKNSDVKKVEIPLPLLSEQRRIVKILDEVFKKTAKTKENAEKNLQNAKELFESYLQSIFTNPKKDWEEKTLKELGKITSSKRIYKKEYAKNGIPFYRIKEIKELANSKEISLKLFISKERYDEIKKTFGIPIIGDILMTAVGTIGEIYVVCNKDEFYFKDGNILWFKYFKSVNPYFLKYVLVFFVEQIKKLSKGSAYNALTIEKIEKHKIFIPRSISEQKSIVKKLDKLSAQTKKLEEIYKEKLLDLKELKKSVLKRAFNGEL